MKRYKLVFIRLVVVIFFQYPGFTAYGQVNCYGVWEYIPGSGIEYFGLDFNGAPRVANFTKVTASDGSPLPGKFEIVKDGLLCDHYVNGFYEDESGSSVQSISTVPKYEDVLIDLTGPKAERIRKNEGRVLKKPGFHNKFLTTHTSTCDIKGRYSGAVRLVWNCGDQLVATTPDAYTFFDPSTGYLMRFNEDDGGRSAFYCQYKKVGDDQQPATVAIKASSNPTELEPDGESASSISAILYESIPGDNSKSKPVSGKTLTFEIQVMDGVKPGSLSSATAVTDGNGMATVTYTAPSVEVLEKMRAFARNSTSIIIRDHESGAEDLAYINFKSDDGKIWVTPSPGIISDQGFVPPHKDYPATINVHLEGTTEPNAEITFSIKEDDPVGMLRSPDGKEGKQIAVKTDGEGNAHVQYFYAAPTLPQKRITETIEARTKNMAIPLTASVSTAFNIVLENAVSGYEGKGQLNAGEEVPLKITVKDEWNPELNLEEMLTYWGTDEGSGDKKLHVKLEIKKQGLVPSSMLDLLGEQNYPEPLYEELLVPKSFDGVKNLLYIPEYSLKKKGFPVVKPNFSGNNNYEINVSLVDEKGKPVFESAHPRAIAYVSVPTGLAADAFSIWFATNPLGPHTEEARFFRMLLGTVTFGEYGGFGSVISLADAAFAINKGDSEALANIMLSEIKNQVLSDAADKTGLTAERIKIYNNMAIADQYLSFALTAESDRGLIAQMESKILSGIANVGFGEPKQMVVLKGDGSQKLFIEPEQSPESDVSKTLKSAFKIKISGLDKNTNDLLKKVGEKIKGKGKEIPSVEGKYTYDDNLKTVSLKNGNVIIYVVPSGLKVVSENASDMKIY